MSRRLLTLNALLGAISLACLVYVVRAATRTPAAPASPPRAAVPDAPPAPRPATASRRPSQGYAVIATRSLFSPTRTEAVSTVPLPTVTAAQKPSLQGVVLRDGAPIAYLEDPVTRRVAGYRLGDSIAGGTVQTITVDRVVIARADGKLDVLLHDPTRPRVTVAPSRPPASRPSAPEGPAPPTSPDVPPR